MIGGRFERGNGRMQQLVDNAAGHGVNGGFLLRRDRPQPAADAVNLRLPDSFTIFLERKNRRHHGQRLHARGKAVHLQLDDLFRTLGLFLAFSGVV